MLSFRGAVLRRAALEPARAYHGETVEKLKSVCDTLKHSAAVLLQHGYRTSTAEATVEQANTLR